MLWIFGYGSLVWRPSEQIPFIESKWGYITGFQRLFYQGSTDHRGVPGSPGRVVTLLKTNDEHKVYGKVYGVSDEEAPAVLDYLDFREKGGYSRDEVTVHFDDGASPVQTALVYRATEENEEYLGERPLPDIAQQIFESVGPSGANKEYLYQLHDALVEKESLDNHIRDLTMLVRKLDQ
eukprot:TRINITY_DN16636_c0_g1_i1.p1 TRINITY_DN16636_c0_g1~~TRINITY_DN16636_c0_g1_i1.p1  ORF type:complete len:179 (-),score=22.68 TRINITY_DN16636_c0_g1_i1:29-565(-)